MCFHGDNLIKKNISQNIFSLMFTSDVIEINKFTCQTTTIKYHSNSFITQKLFNKQFKYN